MWIKQTRHPFWQAADDANGGAGADGGGDKASAPPEEATAQDEQAKETLPQPLALDELLQDKGLQGEFDRRVTKALDTARVKWEKEARKRADEEKRLASLSASEKAAEALKAAEDRAQALEEEKASILLRQDTTQLLAERKLNAGFVDFVMAGNADDTKARVDAFETMFRSAVEDAVLERIKGKTPPVGNQQKPSITQGEFDRMNYTQKAGLFRTDPQQYARLTGRA